MPERLSQNKSRQQKRLCVSACYIPTLWHSYILSVRQNILLSFEIDATGPNINTSAFRFTNYMHCVDCTMLSSGSVRPIERFVTF